MSADKIILDLAEKQAIFELMAALCLTASTPTTLSARQHASPRTSWASTGKTVSAR